MIRPLAALSLAALGACASTQQGTFAAHRFESGKYPYAVYFEEGKPEHFASDDWRLDNYFEKEEIDTTGKATRALEPKHGAEWDVKRSYDVDDDGRADEAEKEAFYDVLLEHRAVDANMWLRTVPLSGHDREKGLRVLADRYVEAVSGAGAIAVRFGAESVRAVEKRFASRVLNTSACTVSGKEALLVDFEVANVDQLQLSDAARWLRGRLVLVRTGYDKVITTGSAASNAEKKTPFPVLMLLGLSSSPGDFAGLEDDFDGFLGRVALGAQGQPLPAAGEHTCRVQEAVAAPAAEATPATVEGAKAPEPGSEAAPASAPATVPAAPEPTQAPAQP
jgi:hypothetical protein